MARIVVMGAGIGGISQAYELRKEFGKQHEIVLIGDSSRFEFTPSNPWVAVGWRELQQVTIELPDLMRKYNIEFHESEDDDALRDRLARFYAQRTLTQRPVTTEDQSEAAYLMISGQLSKTTGQIISVDGGLHEAFMR